MPPPDYLPIRAAVERMDGVASRQMFGYRCFLVAGKFFAGFYNKNDFCVIIRLAGDQQEAAIKEGAIKPFSHGAKKGWVELDCREVTDDIAMKWISKGYDHAKRLAQNPQ